MTSQGLQLPDPRTLPQSELARPPSCGSPAPFQPPHPIPRLPQLEMREPLSWGPAQSSHLINSPCALFPVFINSLDDFHPILKKIIYMPRALKSLPTLTSLLFSRSFLAILPTAQTHSLPGSTPQHLPPLNTLSNVLPYGIVLLLVSLSSQSRTEVFKGREFSCAAH